MTMSKGWKTALTLIVLFIAAIVVSYLFARWRAGTGQRSTKHVFTTPIGVSMPVSKKITITGCIPDPDAAAVSTTTPVTFVNNDPIAHTLFFREAQLRLPPRGAVDITFSFYRIPGPRYYACDSNKQVGIITVPFRSSTSLTGVATTTIK